MDDAEFYTPVDSRLERDHKSVTTLETQTNLSSISFNNTTSIRTNESTAEEEGENNEDFRESQVTSGFSSILFLPLVDAVFRPASLKRELLVGLDLVRLCKTVVVTAKTTENPFSLLGNYVKGLCIVFSHQVKFLSSDFTVYSKNLVGTEFAVVKQEAISYYESDDDDEYKARKKYKKKRKIRDTDSVSTIQDYSEKYQSEIVPIERLEMLRVMNLGLSGNDQFFMKNEINPVLNDYITEMNLPSKISGDKDWLSFDDLRMLSSPFKLNAYSFSPNFDGATVAASSEISYNTSYDIDWSLRNDPLNYNNNYYQNYLNYESYEDETPLYLEDDKTFRRKRRTSIRLYDVDLVRTEIKYDRRPTQYKAKRRSIQRRRSTVEETNKKNKQTEETEKLLDQRQKTLDQMFDNYFNKVVTSDLALVNQSSNLKSYPRISYDQSEKKRPDKSDRPVVQREKETPEVSKEKEVIDKRTETTIKEKDNGSVETTFQEATDGFGTLDILYWLRDAFRKSDYNNIGFDTLAKGLKAGKASVVFLRVLILANSNFVSIAEEKQKIKISPAERFWEPVSARVNVQVGS